MSHDLNIQSYEYLDLLNLFKLDKDSTDNDILKAYNHKKDILANVPVKQTKQRLSVFFQKAYEKLISIRKKKNKKKEVDSFFSHKNKILTSGTSRVNAIPIKPTPLEITHINDSKYSVGKINPVKKKVITKILSIDTLFRDNYHSTDSTDFVYKLPVALNNVVSMKIVASEIPNTSYFYNSKLLNNTFRIDISNAFYVRMDKSPSAVLTQIKDNSKNIIPSYKTLNITINDGTWNSSSFSSQINSLLNNARNEFSYLTTEIEPNSGKFIFRFKTDLEIQSWKDSYTYTNSNQRESIAPDGKQVIEELNGISIDDISNGNFSYKVYLNPTNIDIRKSLGWKLGFRQKSTYGLIDRTSTYQFWDISYQGYLKSESIYGESKNDYFFIVVDDFVGNYGDSIIHSDNKSYMAKGILGRIQMKFNMFNVNIEDAGDNIYKEREYFGPVRLEKLHIKIIDKFGIPIDLGETDYSIALEIKQLYSQV